jgi:hypothetical protein
MPRVRVKFKPGYILNLDQDEAERAIQANPGAMIVERGGEAPAKTDSGSGTKPGSKPAPKAATKPATEPEGAGKPRPDEGAPG